MNSIAQEFERAVNSPFVSAMQDIPLSAIQESPTNPRSQFEELNSRNFPTTSGGTASCSPCPSARCRTLELTGVKKKVKKSSGIAAAKAAKRK